VTTVFVRLERRVRWLLIGTDDNAHNADIGVVPDSRSGDWLPATDANGADIEKKLAGPGDTQSDSVVFSAEGGTQYSLFLEEWEPGLDKSDLKGRLVYADRLRLAI
jgi:hypothetical protein